MKLNFWQILGVIIIVVGLVFVIRDRNKAKTPPTTSDVQNAVDTLTR